MNSDGTNQRQLTSSPYDEYSGSWSPDGRTVTYYADSGGTFWLGEVSRDAAGSWGKSHLVLSGVPGQGTFSPDGRRLLATHDGHLSIIDAESWRDTPITPPILTAQGVRAGLWTADGRGVYYRGREPDGRLSLLLLHLDGSRPDTLVRPRDTSRASLRADWTSDGKRLFFTINSYEGDVWTVEVR
jgi:Tol biopolymer transport system component